MKKNGSYLFLLFLTLGLLSACERNDDEPLLPKTVISRLYVSFSDIDTSDLDDPARHIAVFDPFTAEAIEQPDLYTTAVLEGAGIHFDPYAGRVFQGSFQRQTITHYPVSAQGSIGTGATSFRDSTLQSQRDLTYDHDNRTLYVTDNLAGSIFVYSQALSRNGDERASKKFVLGGQPWGLHLQADSSGSKSLFVALAGAAREVRMLENIDAIDSGVVDGGQRITIEGAGDLRGIAFSPELNLLVVTDFGSGKLYMVENARQVLQTGGSVTPTRTLSGSQTQLRGPIDVEIDSRPEQMKLYVIDRTARKLLRFKISDEGNASPESFYDFGPDRTPVSIHIDVR